jgi:hypothetical protein
MKCTRYELYGQARPSRRMQGLFVFFKVGWSGRKISVGI